MTHFQGYTADPYVRGGRRRCQEVMLWNATPAWTNVASPRSAATSWNAIGSPASLKPPGSVIVGLPVTLNGQVYRCSFAIRSGCSPSVRIVARVSGANGCTGGHEQIDRAEQRGDTAAKVQAPQQDLLIVETG